MKTLVHSVVISILILTPLIELNATTMSGEVVSNISESDPSASDSTSGVFLSEIPNSNNASISDVTENPILNAAPTQGNINPILVNNTYTAWELMHRIPMLSGFMWTGEIAKFITPQMYVGTPFVENTYYMAQSNPWASYLLNDPTTYSECLQNESYLSYGLGERIETTDISELKAIAKTCAQQFYGKYFDGKNYTTREEYLMMLFTMFGEDVSFKGEFTPDGIYHTAGNGLNTYFENVRSTYWYAPSINLAHEIGIISSNEKTWTVGREISDTEAISILARYTAYRMNFTGPVLEKGMIITEKLKYYFSFQNENKVTIHVQ